ncbi:MAG: virulence RhuM family protein [Magnetococcales bacterium]|nr:virulence RhuM family protein [Magnetococcales bacterium]
MSTKRVSSTDDLAYFNELLKRIRAIRASEKRTYEEVKKLFALSEDYKKTSTESQHFFKFVQSNFHCAITGYTGAELICERADHRKTDMGLTSIKGARVAKGDVTIAKNYYNLEEISALGQLVTMWLDYAEGQAERHQYVCLEDWEDKLRKFLEMNDRPILEGGGDVSKRDADEYAKGEYGKYKAAQKKAGMRKLK